jgi:hypothetical protein
MNVLAASGSEVTTLIKLANLMKLTFTFLTRIITLITDFEGADLAVCDCVVELGYVSVSLIK